MTAFSITGEIWLSRSRIRLRLPVRRATSVLSLSSAYRTEFSAFLYSAWLSSAGRSLATAMSIPNTVETRARQARPKRMNASRSFFTRVRGGWGGGPPLPACGPGSTGAAVGVRGSVDVGGSFIYGGSGRETRAPRSVLRRPARARPYARALDEGGSLALGR